jgi:hypothetical protein
LRLGVSLCNFLQMTLQAIAEDSPKRSRCRCTARRRADRLTHHEQVSAGQRRPVASCHVGVSNARAFSATSDVAWFCARAPKPVGSTQFLNHSFWRLNHSIKSPASRPSLRFSRGEAAILAEDIGRSAAFHRVW